MTGAPLLFYYVIKLLEYLRGVVQWVMQYEEMLTLPEHLLPPLLCAGSRPFHFFSYCPDFIPVLPPPYLIDLLFSMVMCYR